MTDTENEQILSEQKPATSPTQLTPSLLLTALQREHPDWITEIIEAHREVTAIVPREQLHALCAHLKSDPNTQFDFLADICGVDRGAEEDPRFEVNYHLFSTTRYHRIRLKILLSDEDTRVPTVTNIWRTANWHERETYDLFGVIFEGHPDLRRILLPDDWQGHALRKDFPLRGYEPYSLK